MRRNEADAFAARLGMPFIKINDGSVHLTARDALWMDHTNFNSAQRTLLLNNSLNAAACNGPPLYTQTPHQTDFYIDAHPHNEYAGNLMSTVDRSQSPHHYQYAALASAPSSAMSTFCAGQQVILFPSYGWLICPHLMCYLFLVSSRSFGFCGQYMQY